MSEERSVNVVPREKAVFWMDAEGRWCNRHGRFENPRISHHFHASIRSDERGYYLLQDHGAYLEKVYFPFADTALFVVNILGREDLELVLNTGERLRLNPESLFISNDRLYLRLCGHRVKFNAKSLVRMARHLEFEGQDCFIRSREARYRIGDAAG